MPTLAEIDLVAAGENRANRQQQRLVARIKRTSKYAYQAPDTKGGWFDVRVSPDSLGYGLRGNNNQYRFRDVVFGIRLESGEVVELKS